MPHSHNSVPLTTRAPAVNPYAPWVLSYFAQRRIAGWIGICLPIIVAILTVSIDPSHRLPDSISASYYTIARNYFVSSLASVAIFLISAVGYDEDRALSFFAGAMAFLVAFSPCTPRWIGNTPLHSRIHGVAAILLFLDFAYMCLFRFTLTNSAEEMTPEKHSRNKVFRICGAFMLVAMAGQLAGMILEHIDKMPISHLTYAVETVCLIAFGFAWIVKGQMLFADCDPK